ncbi:conserved hypothetical protein [Altererythrobacter sp. B11]|uniref:hypothetical protein n=1 Tax=Altererythrobacter sp. B11 TaxID=2060312 RepID=UPI000DC734F0|nr:hypothetical protein [Altererythrobacter sp. B11]BBC72951.1 conserved hypothetical protein [Altererythrobacter sp. B11]
MSDHPSTFNATDTVPDAVEWDDHATIHLKDDGQGILDGMKAIHRGTLAEMVAMASRMSPEERGRLVIQKGGDRMFGPDEIMALADRRDFPG